MRLGLGDVRDGVEHGSECGVADGKAGRGWHEIEVARGGDGQGCVIGQRLGDGRRRVGVVFDQLLSQLGDALGSDVWFCCYRRQQCLCFRFQR